jgi:putative FmdB family regulatory protein
MSGAALTASNEADRREIVRTTMPIYEYQCDKCGAEFQDLVMSRAAEIDVRCKQCNSEQVTKLLSGSAVKSGASTSPASSAPRTGGCGGGCSCH